MPQKIAWLYFFTNEARIRDPEHIKSLQLNTQIRAQHGPLLLFDKKKARDFSRAFFKSYKI